MTTSVVFDDIDYSQIEYDTSSTDETMLTDPSASIIALQGLRVLKTRETGDEVVEPDTTGREQTTMLNYNEISYEEYRMRRKAEVLKYKKNTTTNKRTQYSALATSRRGQIANTSSVSTTCENDVIRVKKATGSGIRGDQSLLFLNPNVSFHDKL
jgi:hypothetical protein